MRQNTIKLHTIDDKLQTGEAGWRNRGQQRAAVAEGEGPGSAWGQMCLNRVRGGAEEKLLSSQVRSDSYPCPVLYFKNGECYILNLNASRLWAWHSQAQTSD